MGEEEKRDLIDLVSRCLAEERSTAPRGQERDTFAYDIQVEEGGNTSRLRYDDADLPDSALPLLEFLKNRSGPLGPDHS